MYVQSLNGSWSVAKSDGSLVLPATVPGCIHTDLLAAGKITDPFFRDDEDRVLWVGHSDWTYSRVFAVSADLLRHGRVLLRCEGLDTLATLVLNGRELASVDNMFRTWEFDVKDYLKAGENTLEVRFSSPVPYMSRKQGERRIPSWSGGREPGGRAWVRKEPCSFGWDWGPVTITCGVWRPISLLAFDDARIADVHVRQDHAVAGQVTLNVALAAEVVGTGALSATVSVTRNGAVVAESAAAVNQGAANLSLTVANPELWWPNNLGPQPLYDIAVALKDAAGSEVDRKTQRIGLRTLRLDRHPDEWGESFQFVINGVPFFAKGANWIPADALQTRMTRARYADLIGSAARGNFNFLRLWGGGVYEDDVFYELCDELGICIWHDFMFACAAYPTFDEPFMRSVEAEFVDNVKRVRHHPCIALWCGNNELEQGLVGDAWTDHQMSWEDYGKLFDKLLPDVLARLDPDRDYWPCSPHTPPPGDRKNFNDPTRGDAHLWDVWHGRKPFEWYRTCKHRFNSEFGFQSFPEPKTVYGYTLPQDRNVTTFVMEHHQRSGIGNAVIMQYMLDWFRLPTQFEMILWASQILQGMAMKYAVEHWRRAMPRGMGTIYWQFDDTWPVASWASVDFHGRWKALQYMSRNFYAPLLVSGVENLGTGTVEVHVTNDLRTAQTGEMQWVLTDLAGIAVAQGSVPVTAESGKNALVTTLQLQTYLDNGGARRLILWLDLNVDGRCVASNLVLFARPKHLELADPEVKMVARKVTRTEYLVTLTARQPALWAWLELRDIEGRFSDNFVHLRPGVPAEITVTLAEPLQVTEFKQHLRVASLFDTYRA